MGKKLQKTISCKLQFTDNARFMAGSLSNLIDNCAEDIFIKFYKN